MSLVYQPRGPRLLDPTLLGVAAVSFKTNKLLVKKRRRRRPHARAHAPHHILTSVGHAADDRADPTNNPSSKRPARLADLCKIARRRSLDQSPSSS